jgi:hypothetical protein
MAQGNLAEALKPIWMDLPSENALQKRSPAMRSGSTVSRVAWAALSTPNPRQVECSKVDKEHSALNRTSLRASYSGLARS